MVFTRPRLIVPMTAIAVLALMLAAIAPTRASPGGATGAPAALADHTTECNVTFDAEGGLLLDGEELAGAELAAVQALLAANADLVVALDAAADANAEACVGLVLDVGEGGITAVINADILVCPATVEVNAEGDLVVNGHVFAADLTDSELAALVDAAAAAGVELCAFVRVLDNLVAATVAVEVCAAVTRDSAEQVTIEFGGVEFLLEADAVSGATDLEVGATVEAGVGLSLTLDLDSDTLAVEAGLFALEGCGDDDTGGGGAPTPTPAPTVGATPAPAAPVLPDTGVQSDSASATATVAALLALATVLTLGVAAYAGFARRVR